MRTINFTEQVSPFSKTTLKNSSFKYSVNCENCEVSEVSKFTSYKLALEFKKLISKTFINYNYTIQKIK